MRNREKTSMHGAGRDDASRGTRASTAAPAASACRRSAGMWLGHHVLHAGAGCQGGQAAAPHPNGDRKDGAQHAHQQQRLLEQAQGGVGVGDLQGGRGSAGSCVGFHSGGGASPGPGRMGVRCVEKPRRRPAATPAPSRAPGHAHLPPCFSSYSFYSTFRDAALTCSDSSFISCTRLVSRSTTTGLRAGQGWVGQPGWVGGDVQRLALHAQRADKQWGPTCMVASRHNGAHQAGSPPQDAQEGSSSHGSCHTGTCQLHSSQAHRPMTSR